eukprot:3659085-Rhodomonas_salina.1
MPASADLVRAFMAFLVAADLAASSIARYMQALKDHHSRHRKPFPVAAVELKRWIRAVTRISTWTLPQLAPVSAEQLRRLLLLPMRTLSELQDALLTALCTVLACRPSDLVNIDVCDVLLSYLNDPPGTAA